MISRLIILVFLSITIQTIVAQELEPVIIPAKVKTKEVKTTLPPAKQDVSEQVELVVEKPHEIETVKAPIINESSLENIERNPNTYRKEEYLNKLLRQTYYQKLTTTQWSKYLNPTGWNQSVQKWRYWSQLKNHVTGNDNDILVIRTPSDQTNNSTALKAEPLVFIDTNQIEEVAAAEIEEVKIDSEIINAAPLITAIAPGQTDTVEVAKKSEDFSSEINVKKETTPQVVLTNVSSAPWLKEKLEESTVGTLQSELDITEETIEKAKDINVEEDATMEEPSIASTANSDIQSTYEEPIEKTPTETSNEVVVETITPIQKESTPVVTNYISEPSTSYATGVTAKDFHLLQGKVPWPVNGRITDRFGIRKNAEARGLKRENYGIDMICPTGTIVKAVHTGTVIMSRRQSPYDYIVTIKHGEYSTAYYYLITPYVKQGDEVQSGQAIGQLRTSVEEADFHFEIWNNTDRVNPEGWLSPK